MNFGVYNFLVYTVVWTVVYTEMNRICFIMNHFLLAVTFVQNLLDNFSSPMQKLQIAFDGDFCIRCWNQCTRNNGENLRKIAIVQSKLTASLLELCVEAFFNPRPLQAFSWLNIFLNLARECYFFVISCKKFTCICSTSRLDPSLYFAYFYFYL